MSGTVFYRGQQLGRTDLNIFLVNPAEAPIDAAEISYALYDFTTGQEVLVGPEARTPIHPSVGEYYASFVVPLDANRGSYRMRWRFRELVNGPQQEVVQEFLIVDQAGQSTSSASMITGNAINPSQTELGLMNRLRILLRDQAPDRHYHFRPPAHEQTLQQFNRVFGYIWEDVELQEYLNTAVGMVGAAPPRTAYANVDQMMTGRPEWSTMLLTGAMMFALQALRIGWIADEFSLAPETLVRLYFEDGRAVDREMGHLYRTSRNILQLEDDIDREIRTALPEGKLYVDAVQGREVVRVQLAGILEHFTYYRPMYEVTTPLGMVSATGDHSLFQYADVGDMHACRADELKVGDALAVVVDGKLTEAPITEIRKAPSYVWTYDLSVPGPQNFVLTSGVLAHNSYSIGGVSLDLEKSSKYEGAYQSAKDLFDAQIEKAKMTVNVVRGLQQPRMNSGIRGMLGPNLGRGILSARNYVGF